jgi:hypothetical protein
MAGGILGNPIQAGILGLPDPTGVGILSGGLHDAMAYFSGHPEAAGQLFPAIQQAQQYQYVQSLLGPVAVQADAQSPSQTASGSAPLPTAQQAQAAPGYSDLSPQGQAVYSQIPHIPGMPARQALSFYLTDPTAYNTAAAKQYELTDLQKNTSAAYGSGTPEANAMMRGTLAKGAAVNIRPGGGALNYADNSIITMPGQNGVQTTFPYGANGPAVMGLVPGAAPAIAGSQYATTAGKNAATPAIGYDKEGMPRPTNALAQTGNPNTLGLSGQPGLPPANLPRIGQAPQNAGLMPALPASQGPYMAGQGKDASDRHDQTIQEALGSPDRVNVLDNIINLSQSGVATGNGQDWQMKALGTVANLPGLSTVMSGAKDNVAKFQELQKFLQQNGQRAWQAAGGTGTDAQLEAASHANPNDAQFPQALQTVAKWVKAGEMAVQAKANAQDRYLQANGNTAANQIAFENQWRNAMDRRVFQLQAMTPQEQAAYIKTLSPRDAATIRIKRQQLMALGAQ